MAESSDLLSVPLRRRIIASRRIVSSAGVTEGVIPCSNATSSCGRPQKKWANEPKLKLALNELQKAGKSIRSVATEYDIPNTIFPIRYSQYDIPNTIFPIRYSQYDIPNSTLHEYPTPTKWGIRGNPFVRGEDRNR